MPSSSGLYGGEGGGEERGGGGKLRKPPARRPPSTPYDRPPSNQSQAASQRPDGGWLSKLVDPACRLIAGGATRIFPSIFSKSSSSAASSAEDHDNEDTEIDEEANYDMQGSSMNFGKSEATGGTNPRKGEAKLNCSSDFDPLGQENTSNLPQGSEFSKIEQMVKAGTFSRDDINRLTEILSSRVADLSNVDSEEKKLNMALKREGKGAVLVSENPRASTEEKQGDLDGARVDSLITLPQFAVKEVVGASPVDIARAYMGSRVAEVGTDSKRIGSKAETFLLQSDGYASPLIPALSSKSSVCWPGTMVQDQHDYSTPRSSRYGLHHFQRTPYSRTIYSKSKPELTRSQADKKRLLGILSTPRLESQTPLFGQGEVRNDGNGSVGPIRRSRSKFHSEAPPRGSGSFHFSQTGPSQVGNSNISLLHGVKKNLEVGSTSRTREFQSVDNMTNIAKVRVPTLQTSNPAARAILEHLDRNTPTPKEKSAELQLATAWKKTSSSNVTAAMPKEGTRLQHLEVFDYHKNTNLADKDSSVKENDRDNSNFEDRRQERSTTEATDVNKHTETSSKLNGSHGSQIKFTNETASFGFTDSREKGTNQLWPLLNQIKGQGTTNMPFNSTGSESLIKIPFQPSGTKPNLASISVDKPHLRQSIFPDSGFSFPVTGSSGVLSEPPTPSIMPFSVASSPAQLKDGLAIPAYTFGTKRSTPALVFSFPSTSTASTQDEVSNIKFSFGSDSKNRISFRSVGNDAICY